MFVLCFECFDCSFVCLFGFVWLVRLGGYAHVGVLFSSVGGVRSVCLFVCCKDPEYIGVSKNRLQGEEYGPGPQNTHGVPSSTLESPLIAH